MCASCRRRVAAAFIHVCMGAVFFSSIAQSLKREPFVNGWHNLVFFMIWTYYWYNYVCSTESTFLQDWRNLSSIVTIVNESIDKWCIEGNELKIFVKLKIELKRTFIQLLLCVRTHNYVFKKINYSRNFYMPEIKQLNLK